jgi:predicted permease
LEGLNRVTLDVFLPALIFLSLARSRGDAGELAALAGAGALIVLGSGVVAFPFARLLNASPRVFVPPMMFTNYGNIGLPLIALTFGREALPAAVALFIAGNALHITLGFRLLSNKIGAIEMLRTPMLIATALGLLLRAMEWEIPIPAQTALQMAGDAAIPMMLFALGARMAQANRKHLRAACWGALICPLSGVICLLALLPWLPLSTEAKKILALFAVLPPAVLNQMFAEKFAIDPPQVAAIVLIGNTAAIITIPIAVALVL